MVNSYDFSELGIRALDFVGFHSLCKQNIQSRLYKVLAAANILDWMAQ
jgi:hypothetical protein